MLQPNHPLYDKTWHLEDAASSWYDPFVFIALRDCIEQLAQPLGDHTDFQKMDHDFLKRAEEPGTLVYGFHVGKGARGVYPLDSVYERPRGPIDDDFEPTSIAILKGLGLLGDYVSPEFWFGDFVFDVRAYHVTELGAHFVSACTQLPTHGHPPKNNKVVSVKLCK